MKKRTPFSFLFGLLSLLLFASLTSCSMENVAEGHKGVLVKRPFVFGGDGVDVLNPGRHTIAGSSQLIAIDVRPYKVTEKVEKLNTKDNSPVDFVINFTLQPYDTAVGVLYSKFGVDYYTKLLEQEFLYITREKCKQYDMNPLTNSTIVSEEINTYIKEEGNKIIQRLKIPVKLIAVNMGAVNPPREVMNERAITAATKQREQTIIQESLNQMKRKDSEEKRALADNAYKNFLGLSVSQYIQLQELQVRKIGYEKATNFTVIESGGGNVGFNKSID